MTPRGRLRAALLTAMFLLAATLPASAADRDKDGLRDGFEAKWGVTSPDVRDSDHDGVVDSAEDNDKDKLSNLGEQRFGTNPGRKDSDRDGVPDGREDRDGDGRSNAREQDQRRLPPNLKPTIDRAKRDLPSIRFKCQTANGSAKIVACRFGPVDAKTTIVLVGDSHAMVYSSPIRRVAKSKGWRLTTMTKTACVPLLGIHIPRQREIDGGRTCRAWRRNVIAKLNANPPDLIILAHSDSYKLLEFRGRPIPKEDFPRTWRLGLKQTLSALPSTSRVLVMGDVPRNLSDPRKCLKQNPGNISACVSPKEPSSKRKIESALRDGARAKGASFRTLYAKICSYEPCPLVQGNLMMWRDMTHLTDTFVTKLQPSVRAILESTVPGPARKR